VAPTAVDGEAADGEPDGFATVGKGGKSIQHTAETIFKDLAQVNENRGKKVSVIPSEQASSHSFV
jgi:translation initiation factor 3 subunit C